jgi:hypothetical protein
MIPCIVGENEGGLGPDAESEIIRMYFPALCGLG